MKNKKKWWLIGLAAFARLIKDTNHPRNASGQAPTPLSRGNHIHGTPNIVLRIKQG
jgi:hypothetical protein